MTTKNTATAVVIPMKMDTPVFRAEIPVEPGPGLDALQELVGGDIESIAWNDRTDVTSYIHAEGKFEKSINRRASALMEGTGRLFEADYIAGAYVIVGIDADGDHVDLDGELLRELCPVELIVNVAIGSEQISSCFHAAHALKDIAEKILAIGPAGGRATNPDGSTMLTWEFR